MEHSYSLYTMIFSTMIASTAFSSQQDKKRNACNTASHFTINKPELSKLFQDICQFPQVLHNIIFEMLSLQFSPTTTVKTAHDGTNRICSLTLLGDRQFAVLGRRTIEIWNISPLKLLRTVTHYTEARDVGLTALSHNMLITYSSHKNRHLILHDLAQNSSTKISSPLAITTLIALPLNRIAFCIRSQMVIKVCSVRQERQSPFSSTSTQEIQQLTGHTAPVRTLTALSKSRLASGSQNATIKIWNTIKGRCLRTLTGHSECIMACVALSNDKLAACDSFMSIKIWNISDGTCVKTIPAPTLPAQSDCGLLKHIIAYDKHLLAAYGKQIKIWYPKTGECVLTQTIATDPNMSIHKHQRVIGRGDQLIVANDTGDISVYSIS